MAEEVPPVGEVRPDTPAPLCRIVSRCLRKDPDERYATAAGIVADLFPLLTPTRIGPRAWAKRHPRATAAAAAVTILVTTSAIVPIARWYVDHSRIGFYVFSTGILVLPAIALEPRIKTAVFLSVGFGPRARAVRAPEIDPVNFAPRIRIPILMLGGRYDFLIPIETAQKPLFERFGTPPADKRHFVFEAATFRPGSS